MKWPYHRENGENVKSPYRKRRRKYGESWRLAGIETGSAKISASGQWPAKRQPKYLIINGIIGLKAAGESLSGLCQWRK